MTVINNDRPVIDHTQPVIDHGERQEASFHELRSILPLWQAGDAPSLCLDSTESDRRDHPGVGFAKMADLYRCRVARWIGSKDLLQKAKRAMN